ncbi:MAG: hypothetical protein NTV79_00220, partial [Candidatus Aureabacteria bacterium]|nr:hypothetical protein [Candidatus Auribacterota bacterium]
MVRGLDKFREQFRTHAGQYVLIGGAACDLLMEEAGLEFRATKDLDIVLSVEALNASFVRAFWAFVRAGKYQVQQSATGERRYYRFLKPEDDEYPFMLEWGAQSTRNPLPSTRTMYSDCPGCLTLLSRLTSRRRFAMICELFLMQWYLNRWT